MNRLSLLSLQVNQETDQSAKQAKDTYTYLKEFLSEEKIVKTKPHITIIGGGIVGLMSAYFLIKCGFHITVLEKESFGAAASGRNGGGVLTLGRELVEIPFARLATEIWSSLDKDGIDTKFISSGHVMVARNEYEKEKLLAAQELYRTAGLNMKELTPKKLINLVPDIYPEVKLGLFSETDAQSYPFSTTTSLLKHLNEMGATLVNHCEVIGFNITNGFIEYVITDQGNYHSDAYLICAGPWTTDICKALQEQIIIKPRRSQILVTDIINGRRIHPFVTGNSLYLRQTHAGNVIFGGGGPWEITGFDVTNTTFAMEFLTSRLLELFPSFRNKQLIRAFAGTVELTEDHLPYFGKLNSLENTFISAGYNGHGYGMSAIMGKIMAHSLCYHFRGIRNPIEKSILSNFSVTRFKQKGRE
ncbi:NAD(P)/FAD-dependent oxidoreductase [Peribacillus alkalitolerans]|uniref:NAD(P)/FAD-dependent oxidoreductase n=1 Tax=Peribacillus alkalitolerans TaxID=1550385 RepID=UPI0013D248A9|nr:FAD-dependent oxidoreductase [Peribacillus alkalitolerans]